MIELGTTVQEPDMDWKGTVVEIDGDAFLVDFGGYSLWYSAEELEEL